MKRDMHKRVVKSLETSSGDKRDVQSLRLLFEDNLEQRPLPLDFDVLDGLEQSGVVLLVAHEHFDPTGSRVFSTAPLFPSGVRHFALDESRPQLAPRQRSPRRPRDEPSVCPPVVEHAARSRLLVREQLRAGDERDRADPSSFDVDEDARADDEREPGPLREGSDELGVNGDVDRVWVSDQLKRRGVKVLDEMAEVEREEPARTGGHIVLEREDVELERPGSRSDDALGRMDT